MSRPSAGAVTSERPPWDGGAVYPDLLHHPARGARQVLVVGLLDAAHAYVVDVDPADRGQRGAVAVGMLTPRLGDDSDPLDSEIGHLLSDLGVDLARHIAEGAVALQRVEQHLRLDSHHLGESGGGLVGIRDDAGVRHHGGCRQRQGDGPSVAIEDRPAGRGHDDLAEGVGHFLQDSRIGSGLHVDDAVDEPSHGERQHHQDSYHPGAGDEW